MAIGRIVALIGVALLVMVVNVLASVLYMVLYGYAINPGHDEAFYQAHIQVAAPWCSIVAGIPLMFLAGWWVAGWRNTRNGVHAALVVWLAYAAIDTFVIFAAGAVTMQMAALVAISHLTKLAASYAGARFRGRNG